MDNNTVTELLKNFRSYKFAVLNLKTEGEHEYFLAHLENNTRMSPVYADRKPKFISKYNTSYDFARYTRIVEMIESAVEFVLNDDQQTIIKRKYLNRNTINLTEIADELHKDRTTVGRWHKEAINSLAKALLPISRDYAEITNVDHMFDPEWTFKEPA